MFEVDRLVLQRQFQFRLAAEGERFRESEDDDSALRVVAARYGPAAVLVCVVHSGRTEAAVVGAATSVASGILNDNLSLKDVLRGALSGALDRKSVV